jgi:hypothetical protein
MKKLIAIAVVFALVAGVAFAADVGVDVYGVVEMVNGTSVKDTDMGAGGGWGRTQFGASAENDDGTFGGWFRFRADGWDSGNGKTWGNVWWKPIDQVKLMIGGNNDGLFGADGVTRWGFYQVAGDVGIVSAGNAWGGDNEVFYPGDDVIGGKSFTFSNAFYGGWANAGAIITITPIEALVINLAIPFISSPGRGEDVYKRTAAQVAFNIDGIGKLALTYDGYEADGEPGDHLGTLYTYFNLTAVENLSVDIGIGLPFIQQPDPDDKTSTFHMSAGLGVTFNSGAFGVKTRLVTDFGGVTYDGDTIQERFGMIFDVMPYYAFNDKVTAHLGFGIGILGAQNDKDGKELEDVGKALDPKWHLYPYVTIKSSWWAPNFYAGLKIEAKGYKDADDKDVINWSVPIGIAFSF